MGRVWINPYDSRQRVPWRDFLSREEKDLIKVANLFSSILPMDYQASQDGKRWLLIHKLAKMLDGERPL